MKSKYLILLAMSLGFCALGCSCTKGQPQGSGSTESSSSTESSEQEENVVKEAPVILVNQSKVALGVGDTFMLEASAKNVEEASFLWTVDGDFDNGVVSVSQDGNDALVKALKVGETKLIASMEYDGHTYFRSVEITVKENNDVTLVLSDNVGFDEEGYLVRLSTLSTENGDERSIVPLVTAYKNNGVIQLENFTWTSGDTNVVTADGNKFLSVNEGKTKVVGSGEFEGKTYSVSIAIEVYRPTIVLNEEFTVEVGETELEPLVLSSDVDGDGGDVLYNGEAVGSFDNKTKTATLFKDKLPTTAAFLGEDRLLTLETDLASYAVSVDMYTKIIDKKEELDAMAALSLEASEETAQWDGYFVLGADIDYNGLFKSRLADIDSLCSMVGDSWSNGGMYGFKGVIDGKGHTIAGMRIDNGMALGGFVGVLHIDGVIQNLTFTNASIAANSSLVCGTGGGTVKNIYIQYASVGNGTQKYEGDGSINTHCASFFGFKEPTATANVSNCVVDVMDADVNNDVSVKLAGSEFVAMKNVFVIGGTAEQREKSNATLAFPSIIDFKNNTNAQSRYKKFNANQDFEFWSLESGIPVPKAVYEEIHENAVNFTDKIDYLVSGTEYKFCVDSNYAIVTSNNPLVSIVSGVATVSKDVVGGEEVVFTVKSVYDTAQTGTFTTFPCKLATANWANVVDLTGEKETALYDITDDKVYLAGLGEAKPEVKGALYYVNTEDYTVATYGKDGETSTVYAVAQNAVYKINCKSVTKVISKAEDLHAVRRGYTVIAHGNAGSYDGVLKGTFVMINDIDCTDLVLEDTGKYWESACGFQGTFDGKGHTISNLTVGQNGLFGNLTGATIKNVKFTNISMKSADQGTYVSLFATGVFNSTIDNVSMHFSETGYIAAADKNDVYHTSGLMFYETSYDSTFSNLTFDISALSGVKYLTESLYEDYDIGNDTVKAPPTGSKNQSTYANVTVIVKDLEDVPVFAYKKDKTGYVEVPYPDGAFTIKDANGNVKA